MPFCTLNEGHYRALEARLVVLLDSITDGNPLALVTAGEAQAERTRRVILSGSGQRIIAGLDILPAIGYLAEKLSDRPARGGKPSPADSAAITLEAMSRLTPGEPFSVMKGNVSSAGSLGAFFERLLEQGITPGMYSVSTGMLPADPGPVELVTGRLFQEYCETRNILYPCTPDGILSVSPGRSCRYGTIVFYGFYDLNPGQRRFIRRLAGTGADIHWFSPVHPSSRWRDVYDRTGGFLGELGFRKRHRVDWKHPLSAQAETAEAILSESAMEFDPDVVSVVSVAGELGAAREALDRIAALAEQGIPLHRIAVVTRKPGESILPRLAHHEGIPVAAPLSAPLLEMPLAGLAAAITRMGEEDFHYSSIQSLVATCMLAPDRDPGLAAIAEAVRHTGVRNGLDRWRDALRDDSRLSMLLDEIGDFFDSIDGRFDPVFGLESLRTLILGISCCDVSDPLLDWIFPADGWRNRDPVDRSTFSALLHHHLTETPLVLRPADREGFRLLSFENVRGTLWSALVIMDLEEDIFPSRHIDDPRLPPDLREILELPDLLKREREDAFLLYQAMEASTGQVILVCRYLDSESRQVRPSPFITPLTEKGEEAAIPGLVCRRPASPFGILLGGDLPGQVTARSAKEGIFPEDRYFLARAIRAERSRISSNPFDEYDGIIGTGFYSRDVWTASILENYVRCPFAFMAQRVWKLDRETDPGISFEPDPLEQGNLVHRCLERLVDEKGFLADEDDVMKTLRTVAGEQHLHRRLGSRALADVYLEKLAGALVPALQRLREEGWVPLSTELSLEGRFGDLAVAGRIDLLVRRMDGTLLVADIKTGGSDRMEKGLTADISKGHLFQPCIYRALIQSDPDMSESGSEVSMAYVRIRPGGRFGLALLSGEILSELESSSERNASEIAGLAEAGRFPPVSAGKSCEFCDLRDMCRISPYERVGRKLTGDARLEFFNR